MSCSLSVWSFGTWWISHRAPQDRSYGISRRPTPLHRIQPVETIDDYIVDGNSEHLMPGFIMAILSYVIAKKWHAVSLNTSKSFSGTPTLMQLVILVKVIGAGGIGSLWKFLGYQYTSSKKHPTPPLLKTSAHVLAVALLIGWVVTATDTWLHVASSTVLLTTSKAAAAGEEKSYGRGLSASGTMQRLRRWKRRSATAKFGTIDDRCSQHLL